MIADGKCSLFVPSGLKDAPLPAHYEPVESPVKNALYAQQDNPVGEEVGARPTIATTRRATRAILMC